MKVWVVVDIGCIECDEETKIVGVFADKEKAQSLATGGYFEGGQHSIECFESEVDIEVPV